MYFAFFMFEIFLAAFTLCYRKYFYFIHNYFLQDIGGAYNFSVLPQI
jgi:hypothetical protein